MKRFSPQSHKKFKSFVSSYCWLNTYLPGNFERLSLPSHNLNCFHICISSEMRHLSFFLPSCKTFSNNQKYIYYRHLILLIPSTPICKLQNWTPVFTSILLLYPARLYWVPNLMVLQIHFKSMEKLVFLGRRGINEVMYSP